MKPIFLILLIGVLLSPELFAEPPRAVHYIFDGDVPAKKILVTVFDGIGTVTVSRKAGDAVEKSTFSLSKEDVEKFFRGFEAIAVVRESKLGKETVDTETHHIFIVSDKQRFGENGASFGVPKEKANDEFRKWLATIEPKPEGNK